MIGTPGPTDLDRSPGPLFSPPRRAVLVLWLALAAANLSIGLSLVSDPHRRSDLENVERWGRQWLIDGENPYAPAGVTTSYPPHGIVALSPLGVFPARVVAPAWAVLNVAFAVLAPWLAIRTIRPTATVAECALPVAMFLCWGGVRTLLQFSMMTLTLSMMAMVLADTRPRWGGVCLGLALIKPQIGIPVLLWAMFTRRWRLVAGAAAVVITGYGLFCQRAGVGPVRVATRYVEILKQLYLGDALVVGLANIRELIALTVSSAETVDALSIAIALTLLLAICIVGFREGTRNERLLCSAPALAGVWSLLTFYHLTYGFVVPLPTAMLLIYGRDPATAKVRRTIFGVLQFALMVDVPGVWRRFGAWLNAPGVVNAIVPHFDRFLMMIIFVVVVTLHVRVQWQGLRPAERGAPV